MANYERDRDDGRVYTGDEDGDEHEGSNLPVVLIIAVLVLAAFGGVVWLAYNQGVARGRNEPVRVASAEQAQGNGSQIKVYQQPAGSEEEDDNGQAAAKTAAPPAARTETAAPVAPAPAAVKPAQENPPAPKQQVQAPAPAPVEAKVAPVKTAPPPAATKPPTQLGMAHPAAEALPVAKPPVAKPHVPKPVAEAKPVATKPVRGGGYLLQIGAYKSEAEAMAAWKTYEGKHATLLNGFSPDVQKADLAEKGVWYRLRIASFPDKDGAMALCDRLKAQNGACFLAH